MYTPTMDIARFLPKRKPAVTVNYAEKVEEFMKAYHDNDRGEMERINSILRTLDDKVLTNQFDVVQRLQFIMTGQV